MLELHRVPATSLSLEVAEGLVIADPEGAIRCLDDLHGMGVHLVIDDFGKGYSSLSYLRRMPVHQIKINRSFILSFADDGDDTLVKCMIDIAHNLGMSAVAEGVETEAVLDQLRDLGCDAAQGFFLARPGPAAEIAAWLKRRADSAH